MGWISYKSTTYYIRFWTHLSQIKPYHFGAFILLTPYTSQMMPTDKTQKKKSQWGTRNRNTTRWDAIEYRAEPANLSHVSPSCHDEGAARWLPTLNWCFNFLSDYNVPSIQFCYNNKRFYPKHTHFSILGRGVCVCVCVSERERKSLSIWHLYLCLSSHPTQYDRYDNNNNHERQQHSPSKNFGSLW